MPVLTNHFLNYINMKTITFKLPTITQVEFEVIAHNEDTPVKGNASAIDDETDNETDDYINEELENGNIWAWCTIEVKARYKGYSASDYLGCCSYKSKEDFMTEDGYYPDMKQLAYDNLIEELQDLND